MGRVGGGDFAEAKDIAPRSSFDSVDGKLRMIGGAHGPEIEASAFAVGRSDTVTEFVAELLQFALLAFGVREEFYPVHEMIGFELSPSFQ